MVVGVLQITLGIDAADSLKAKRKVVRSIVERTRSRFNCAVAEVGSHDLYNRAEIGVSVVSNDTSFTNSMLDKILDAVEDQAIGRAEVLDSRLELLHI